MRHRVLAMLFITVVINYLDRSNLSVAEPHPGRDLQLDPFHKGLLLSAFGWAYAFWQIPGGWLVDRIRPRFLFATICGLWSRATLLQGLAGTFVSCSRCACWSACSKSQRSPHARDYAG